MQALSLVFNLQGERLQVQHIVDSLLENTGKLLFQSIAVRDWLSDMEFKDILKCQDEATQQRSEGHLGHQVQGCSMVTGSAVI
jgi:hypothetical protein